MSDIARIITDDYRAVFSVFQEKNGRWRATRADGLVSGLFFDREAAVRFARNSGVPGAAEPIIKEATLPVTPMTRRGPAARTELVLEGATR